MASYILSAAIRAVKSKVGTWKAFESIQDLAPEITREEWAAAIAEARTAIAQRVSELTAPLNRRPTAAEFSGTITRRSSATYWQQVEIYVRDRDTGARSIMHLTTRTDTLRSRMAVVNDWVEHIQNQIDARPDDYPVDIVGAAYTGTYVITQPS